MDRWWKMLAPWKPLRYPDDAKNLRDSLGCLPRPETPANAGTASRRCAITTLTIDLPDNLAQEARDAGLLNPTAIEAMLRENLRRRGVDELFQAMDRMAAVDSPPIMTPEEVAEEIHKMRAERRSRGWSAS
ncbi:MAG: hypothetical protein U5K56_01505 [Halioglobus sp.]|nr:hypothetical protein [Halioglobus sp.]